MRGGRAGEVERAGAAGVDLAGAGALTDCAHALAGLAVAETDAGRIDQIRALEDVKAACAAAQARVTAEFAASQRAAAELAHGALERDALRHTDSRSAKEGSASRGREAAALRAKAARLARRSAAAQVALARRESPALGGRYVGLAEALVHEMPLTLAALADGVISESRATIIVKETACLSAEQRGAVDAEIADRVEGLGDVRLQTMVRKAAYRLEPEAATRRAIRAARDRRVSVRPAPDAMAYLTFLLPLASAVACYGQLRRDADSHPGGDAHGGAGGDPRTSAQRMVDIGVARIMLGGLDARAGDDTSSGAGDPGVGRGVPAASGGRSEFGDPVAALHAAYARPSGARPSGARPSGASNCGPHAYNALIVGTSPEPAGPDADPPLEQTGAEPAGARDDNVEGTTRATATGDRATDSDATSGTGSGGHQPGSGTSYGAPPISGAPSVTPAGRAASTGDSAPRGIATANNAAHGCAANGGTAPGDADVGAFPQGFPPGTGVVVNVVISDSALFAGGDAPAHLSGNLPIPAPLARRMIAELPQDARVWIRRLYARPGTGQLVAMDSRRRAFPAGMRELLFARDLDGCRTPWCNAPARHADHIRPHARGGATSIANGQSLSEDCNYIRTAAGWSAAPNAAGDIVVTTPTGHEYRSPAPVLVPPLVPLRRRDAPVIDLSWAEQRLAQRIVWELAC